MLAKVRAKYQELLEEYAEVDGAQVFWNDATHALLVHFPADEEAEVEAFGTEFTYGNKFWSDAEIDGDRLVDIFEEATSVAAADTRLGGSLGALGIEAKKLAPLFAKEGEDTLRWLTTLPAAAAEIAVQLRTERGLALADLRELLAYNAATHAYPADVVATWVRTHTLTSTRVALTATAAENRREWVDSFLQCEGVNNASAAHRHLIRIRAYLRGGVNTMAVYQADRNYAADASGRSRTGFLRFAFVAGPPAEIHTHWNQDVHRLVSMHVQDGANGCEINQWMQFFGNVGAAVVAAHNAAPGPLAPTGGPVAL